ncbi:MAG: methylated-DNA--[protein]-cysteine S-methyltransferase [Firmicutes bacterium]|nr:methylated-DNA--[protein]-cysteine S-methyltransferase [Bacillota bacterium]
MESAAIFDSPIGPLLLAADSGGLTCVRPAAAADGDPAGSPLLDEACLELAQYFAGSRRVFDLPLAPKGSDFQLRVWQALRSIPYGTTVSYGRLAGIMGCPGGARAVGAAAHRNPLLILTPCHRLIGADGSLTGFACGLEAKRFLLRLEGAAFRDMR